MTSDLGWRADGIARAKAAGGIELETYRRPGFTGSLGVRRTTSAGESAQSFEVDYDPDPGDDRVPFSHRNRSRFRASHDTNRRAIMLVPAPSRAEISYGR